MNKSAKKLINTYPNHYDIVKEQLKDPVFAREWIKGLLEDYSQTHDVNELIIDLKPLIEARYSICEFAQLCGVHRMTLYKTFSRKIIPSIDVLNKIFKTLGYNLTLQIS
jgi:DNA-binding phage protein